jgi:hypothetical protein
MPKILIIILTILISLNSVISTRRTKRTLNTKQNQVPICSDPSTTELETMYTELQARIRMIEDLINIPDYQHYIPDDMKKLSTVISVSDTLIYGENQCDKVNAQSSHHNMGLCPWYTALKYRTDRYPFMQTTALCSCKKCLHINPQSVFEYNCKSYEVLKPVLYRSVNCVDGKNEWKYAVEPVSIACLCQHDYDLKIERKR